jgi:hypothetical protein
MRGETSGFGHRRLLHASDVLRLLLGHAFADSLNDAFLADPPEVTGNSRLPIRRHIQTDFPRENGGMGFGLVGALAGSMDRRGLSPSHCEARKRASMRPVTARGLPSAEGRGAEGDHPPWHDAKGPKGGETPPRGRQTLPWSDGVRRRVRKIEAHDGLGAVAKEINRTTRVAGVRGGKRNATVGGSRRQARKRAAPLRSALTATAPLSVASPKASGRRASRQVPARIPRRRVDAFCSGSPAVRQIAWKGQLRLSKRYRELAAKGKPIQVVVTAIARELLAFMWAIGQVVPPANA